MYCGDNQGTDVDHHEPLALAPYRTFDWLNHLLACSVCNSHFKRDGFPRADDGTPLLLDPTADEPLDHLALSLSVGWYAPRTERGRVTIETLGLKPGRAEPGAPGGVPAHGCAAAAVAGSARRRRRAEDT
jgi:hypothetical protein